jgi:hypothetical protein
MTLRLYLSQDSFLSHENWVRFAGQVSIEARKALTLRRRNFLLTFNTFRPHGVYILRGLSSHQSGAL